MYAVARTYRVGTVFAERDFAEPKNLGLFTTILARKLVKIYKFIYEIVGLRCITRKTVFFF